MVPLHSLITAIVQLSLVHTCLGKIYTRFSNLPTTKFDFVIVGSGAAGNVLANRLTENPRISVLVLEAGGSNEGVLDSEVPFFCPSLSPNTPFDWNFTTTPQIGLNNHTIAFPRGFMLGGSTSINFLAYTRGSMDDWNRFAAITGDKGWSWHRLQRYFRRNERFTRPADHHNTTGEFNPQVHSRRGINSVSLGGFPRPIDQMALQAMQALPDEFPFNVDMNSGKHLGIGWTQGTIKGGRRSSSATSYLGPKFIRRRNLHVLLHARVTRLLQDGMTRGKKSFRKVEFAQNAPGSGVDGPFGPRRTVLASKSVILSAGSVMSPNILMHSGIGDERMLSRVGIQTLHDLPSVGQNLTDHSLTRLAWNVNSTDTYETHLRNATIAAADLAEWKRSETGYLTTTRLSFLGWLRLPPNASIFNRFEDPAAGPNTAHIELLIGNGMNLPPPTGNFLTVSTGVVSPASRGSIKINSNNPFDPPLIDPGLLASEFDLFTMREAIRSVPRFLSAPAWVGYVLSPAGALAEVDFSSDEQLNTYIHNNTGTLFHPVGTNSMSRKGSSSGVVDPDLKVKGIEGLYIVDASVMPRIPAAHTQAPTYVIAERAADLIKEAWDCY
ncbi:GMC oxidoreductase family protein [Pleurotus pulmonarius]